MRGIRELRDLLRGRDFRKLFAVRISSQFADGVFQVALASYLLFSPERQPSAGAIAAALAVVLLPFSLLGPFTGVLLDRWSRRQVLVWSNVVRTGLLLLVAGVVAAGVTGIGLYALILVGLSVNRFLLAALSAALPHVVAPEELVTANALTPTCGTGAYLVGLGLGSAVDSTTDRLGGNGDVVVLLAGSVLYAVAAGLAARIAPALLGPDFDPHRPAVAESVHHVARGLRDGLAHLRRRPAALAGLSAIGAHRFWYGISTVATILLYRDYFYPPSDTAAGFAGLSVAVLVSGAGFVAAALVTPYASRHLSKRGWVVALLAVAAVTEAFPGGLYTVPAVLVSAFFLGLAAQGIKICVDTLVQQQVDDAFRGRVFALYDVLFNMAFVAAAAFSVLVLPDSGKSYAALALVAVGYAGTAVVYALSTRQQTVQLVGHAA